MSFHPNDIIRRGRAATVLVCGAMIFLLSAFFKNQVILNERWRLQSEGNRLRQLPIPAPRGAILDRTGKGIIAESAVAYSVSLLTMNEDTLNAALDRLSEIMPITRKERNDAIKWFRRDKNRPAVIFDDASFDKVAVLEEHRLDFPGLVIQPTPKRTYPTGAAVYAFSGYTSEINEQQLNAREAEGYKAGQQIGKTGLEEQYESHLRGQEGGRSVEVDAHGRVVGGQNVFLERKPVPGKPLQTTIDLDLQEFVYRLFGDSLIGGVVALDPKTGGVLAFHSAPTIDPNRWIGGLPQSYMDSLRTDTVVGRRPLVNRALSGTYPPGSTFKLATSVIALENDVVKFSDHMPQSCGGSYYFGNRSWGCWKKEGHGSLDLFGAIAQSCDVYFYQLGQRIQVTRLVAGSMKLGFNQKTGIDLPNEKTPLFPNANPQALQQNPTAALTAYYDARIGPGRWTLASEVLNLSIGQGANSQTILNMARFYMALANGGMTYTPHLSATSKPDSVRLYSLADAQDSSLLKALVGVTTVGTAAASAMKGVATAGKTGTAQSHVFINGIRQDHAWFAGFAPADNPKIVVVAMIELGGHGTRAAAIVQAIFRQYLKVNVLTPSVTGE
jgi:penicillin-binding protein 2